MKNYVKDNIVYSTYEPIWKVILLSFVTLTFYNYYWLYLNWRFVKYEKNTDIYPLLLALLTGIPIVDLFISYFLFKNIYSIINKNVGKSFDIKAAILSILFSLLGSAVHLKEPYFLLYIFAFIPLIIIQKDLNYFFREEY